MRFYHITYPVYGWVFLKNCKKNNLLLLFTFLLSILLFSSGFIKPRVGEFVQLDQQMFPVFHIKRVKFEKKHVCKIRFVFVLDDDYVYI